MLSVIFHGGFELNKDDVISILKLAQDQKLPENLKSDSGLNLDCIKDLIERGYIQAIDISSKSGVGFMEPKITIAGVEYLEANSTKPKWYHSFPNRIAVISLIVAVIGLWFAVK
jgi:hypothetical protein